jgi:molybdate transport system substrate-binding protein
MFRSVLRILSAGSTLHGLKACAALATQKLSTTIEIKTDHGHNILQDVMRGLAAADIVLLPTDMIDTLNSKNLARDSVALGSVGIGGVVREGMPVPGIATMAKLRATLVAADAVLLTRAPTGDHLLETITELGLRDTIMPNLLRFETASALNRDLAARRDNALGFAPETEIRASTGVTWIGEVPPEIQITLPYAAAILTRTAAPNAARAFLAFLATASAREAFRKTGVSDAMGTRST